MSKGTKYEGHTSGPWEWSQVPLPGRRPPGIADVLKGRAKVHAILRHEGLGWSPTPSDATLIADAPALLACALELREALEPLTDAHPQATGQHRHALALVVERMARGLAALKAFDALTGVSAARVAGKVGGK